MRNEHDSEKWMANLLTMGAAEAAAGIGATLTPADEEFREIEIGGEVVRLYAGVSVFEHIHLISGTRFFSIKREDA